MNTRLITRLLTGTVATVLTAGGLASVVSAPAQAQTSTVGVVTASGGLTMRGTPSSHSRRVGHLDRGTRVTINCKVRGTNVDGNRLWYLLASHDSTDWVSARYVRNVDAAPDYCDPSDGAFVGRTTARLNQREGASAEDKVLGTFARGATIQAVCYTLAGPGNRWIHTAAGRWVSGDYVRVSSQLRYCMN